MLPLVRSKTLVAAAFAVALAAVPTASRAADSRDIQGYDVRVPNSELEAGAARARVQSSHETIRSVLLDYPHYSQIITRFEKARVVGKVGQQTDVYLEVPILHGASKVWAVVRFDAPKLVGGDEVIHGRMVKGNVKQLDANWRVRKVDETSADLVLELLIVPDVPAPRSLILSEVRRAAARAVSGARAEAERRAHH